MSESWKIIREPAAHPPFAYDVEEEHMRLWLYDVDGLVTAALRTRGETWSVHLSLPHLARLMIATGSSGLVMAHNHPSGDARPSRADIASTRAVWRMARSLGCALHDHVIVGRDGLFSFRENGLL